MSEVIFLEGVSKSYRDKRFSLFQALNDVSFKVEQGEAFGFVGPNGAGKSTTIRILTGIIRAFEGEVRLFGQSVLQHESRRGLGYVPENPYLYDYLTPLEILDMGIRLHGISVSDRRKHCLEWLDRFNIAHVADKRIRQFSKGMVQRTALAHAMACQPRLLILDEPLSGLDPIGRREVVDILEQYHRDGGTLFFSSHVLHDVERLADRFGLIHLGQLKAVLTPSELLDQDGGYVIVSVGDQAIVGAISLGKRRWRLEVGSTQLWATLELLRSLGHELHEVRPGMTLERVFHQFVDRS
ncbi:ABC transporter ATP-binding protein [Chitinimonas sp. BJB300]|nr:ABC transporter ATP-binding protein [Chitinimonas sp. BJB300]TSJ83035.1 ABC transporter ATP-binding protein [Chitinimonas sp. BJB300]